MTSNKPSSPEYLGKNRRPGRFFVPSCLPSATDIPSWPRDPVNSNQDRAVPLFGRCRSAGWHLGLNHDYDERHETPAFTSSATARPPLREDRFAGDRCAASDIGASRCAGSPSACAGTGSRVYASPLGRTVETASILGTAWAGGASCLGCERSPTDGGSKIPVRIEANTPTRRGLG